MIPHRKHVLFGALFFAYARHSLKQTFSAVRISGLEHAQRGLAEGPLVVVSNHASWWDSLVVMYLSTYAFPPSPTDGFAMMDAHNLRRFPFFQRLGVFGFDLDRPEDRRAVVAYAAGLLQRPGQHVWIFPQGAERPVTEPLAFHPGAPRIAYLAQARILPMAVRYEHGRLPKPSIYIAFGEPILPLEDEGEATRRLERTVAGLLDLIEQEVRAEARGAGSFPAALGGRGARTGFFGRLLSWLLGARR